MAKVVINGRFLGMRTTGVQRFAYETIVELDKIAKPEQFEIAIPTNIDTKVSFKNIKIVHVGKLKNRLWEHISFPLYAMRKKSVPLSFCNVAPLLKPGVASILDMKVLAHPEFFSKKFVLWYKLLFWNIVKRSKKILTISEFSKSEILKYYKISEDRIVVVPCGWQQLDRIDADPGALEKFSVSKGEYFFSMSSLDPNKNFKWVAEVAKKNPTQEFVIAGGMNAKVFSKKFDFSTPKNLRFLGYVSDGEAKTLMRSCKAFLFPSFYEGFGIPPLEAMSTGCPIIVSDIPVMHEIFGESVRYVDPKDSNVDLDELLKRQILSATPILKKYSWEKSAERIMDCFETGLT